MTALRFAWIACFLGSPACLAQGRGTVCLEPGGFDDFAKGGATVEEDLAHQRSSESVTPREAVRFVQIDRLAPVEVTSRKPGRIAGLDTTGTHAARIARRADMTGMQTTFRFSFAGHPSGRLCLWYESFYGSWQLQDGKSCHCR